MGWEEKKVGCFGLGVDEWMEGRGVGLGDVESVVKCKIGN